MVGPLPSGGPRQPPVVSEVDVHAALAAGVGSPSTSVSQLLFSASMRPIGGLRSPRATISFMWSLSDSWSFSHTGRRDPVFPLCASPKDVLETILRDFP